MQPIHPPISKEIQEKLKNSGLIKYEARPLDNWNNPFSTTYKFTSLAIMAFGLLGRFNALRTGAPSYLWTTLVFSVPAAYLISKIKLDSLDDQLGHRKTLKERLEYYPVTRNAWNKALEVNEKYQNELKEEIKGLENLLALQKKI